MHLAELARHDLNTLVALHALLETRSVSRAAERLNLSQPAVSRTLARLREAFDDPLFVRAQRGLRPTARAEALRQPLARLLQELGALLAPPEFSPADSQRRFQLATTDYGMHPSGHPGLWWQCRTTAGGRGAGACDVRAHRQGAGRRAWARDRG